MLVTTTRSRARSNSLLSFRSRRTRAIDRMLLRPSAAGEIDVLATWRPPEQHAGVGMHRRGQGIRQLEKTRCPLRRPKPPLGMVPASSWKAVQRRSLPQKTLAPPPRSRPTVPMPMYQMDSCWTPGSTQFRGTAVARPMARVDDGIWGDSIPIRALPIRLRSARLET
jgi:hypothetical protein